MRICFHPKRTRTVLAGRNATWEDGRRTTRVEYQCGKCKRLKSAELDGRFNLQQVEDAWHGKPVEGG